MIFNLIPIPPLDGSHVLFALLDPRTTWQVRPSSSSTGSSSCSRDPAAVFGGQTLLGSSSTICCCRCISS